MKKYSMDKISVERMRPIREEVYLVIRRKILYGEFQPGDRLQEEQLAKQFGTSRTPVREALRKLEVEKFVSYYPHHGTVVTEIAADEAEELLEVRIFIESLLLRRVAKNASLEDIRKLREIIDEGENLNDPDAILANVDFFNASLFALGRCEHLQSLNIRIRELLKRVVVSKYLNPQRHTEAVAEHRLILDALEAGDVDLAVTRNANHLKHLPAPCKTDPKD
jgi:DNA-binding GntR family transcriptional regulator